MVEQMVANHLAGVRFSLPAPENFKKTVFKLWIRKGICV